MLYLLKQNYAYQREEVDLDDSTNMPYNYVINYPSPNLIRTKLVPFSQNNRIMRVFDQRLIFRKRTKRRITEWTIWIIIMADPQVIIVVAVSTKVIANIAVRCRRRRTRHRSRSCKLCWRWQSKAMMMMMWLRRMKACWMSFRCRWLVHRMIYGPFPFNALQGYKEYWRYFFAITNKNWHKRKRKCT